MTVARDTGITKILAKSPQVAQIALIALIALVFRVVDTGRFTTTDEYGFFLGWTEGFRNAVRAGDFLATRQSPQYPAVTVHWLGTLGWMLLDWRVSLFGPVDFVASMQTLRLPIAIVCAVCPIIGLFLLRNLIGAPVAFLCALLWATDPFLIAYSRILGVDGLLASFMIVAALLITRAFYKVRDGTIVINWKALTLAGAASGLAVLTKLPSVALFGFFILVLLRPFARQDIKYTLVALTYFFGVALVVFVALYPAMWIEPVNTLRGFSEGIDLASKPHENGNFFLGKVVDNPGPLYYPTAISLRLTPWTLVGIMLVSILALSGKLAEVEQRVVLRLSMYILIVLFIITIAPKKFDRYALPIFPALDILAGIGLYRFTTLVSRGLTFTRRNGTFLIWLPLIIGLLLNLSWYHPYQIAYYNPLLGGGKTAEQAILVGWGEGVEFAGDYITDQPNSCSQAVIAWVSFLLKPYICSWVDNTLPVDSPEAGFIVFYVSQLQRGIDRAEFQAMLDAKRPDHIVRLHDINYAYVFKLSSATNGNSR